MMKRRVAERERGVGSPERRSPQGSWIAPSIVTPESCENLEQRDAVLHDYSNLKMCITVLATTDISSLFDLSSDFGQARKAAVEGSPSLHAPRAFNTPPEHSKQTLTRKGHRDSYDPARIGNGPGPPVQAARGATALCGRNHETPTGAARRAATRVAETLAAPRRAPVGPPHQPHISSQTFCGCKSPVVSNRTCCRPSSGSRKRKWRRKPDCCAWQSKKKQVVCISRPLKTATSPEQCWGSCPTPNSGASGAPSGGHSPPMGTSGSPQPDTGCGRHTEWGWILRDSTGSCRPTGETGTHSAHWGPWLPAQGRQGDSPPRLSNEPAGGSSLGVAASVGAAAVSRQWGPAGHG